MDGLPFSWAPKFKGESTKWHTDLAQSQLHYPATLATASPWANNKQGDRIVTGEPTNQEQGTSLLEPKVALFMLMQYKTNDKQGQKIETPFV